MTDLEFKECASCAAKPGMPVLCSACLHNRRVIDQLARKPDTQRDEFFWAGICFCASFTIALLSLFSPVVYSLFQGLGRLIVSFFAG